VTKISGSVVYFKYIFPGVWFGFLLFFLVTSFMAGAPPLFQIAPIGMAVFGVFLFRKLAWSLVDEVYDGGDYLVFRRGRVEQRVPLDDVMNIDSQLDSPPKVTIHVRSQGPLGRELSFSPPFRLFSLATPPIVTDLIERVDRIRRGA